MIFGSLNYFQIKILLIKIYIIIIIFWAWPCVYIKIKFYSFNKFYLKILYKNINYVI